MRLVIFLNDQAVEFAIDDDGTVHPPIPPKRSHHSDNQEPPLAPTNQTWYPVATPQNRSDPRRNP